MLLSIERNDESHFRDYFTNRLLTSKSNSELLEEADSCCLRSPVSLQSSEGRRIRWAAITDAASPSPRRLSVKSPTLSAEL